MKYSIFQKALLVVLLSFGMTAHVNAQTVIDITTGNASTGSNDPIWTVKPVGASSFGPAKVAVPVSGYATNSCGNWIAHDVYNTPGQASHHLPQSGPAGDYVYRTSFNVTSDDCFVNAVLDVSFAAADNELTSLKINGSSISIPTGIDFHPGTSFIRDISSEVVIGNNVLEVTVDNWGSYEALQLCGDITISAALTTYTTTTVDLTTGAGSVVPGNFDANWTVSIPGSSTYASAYVANDIVDYNDSTNSYDTNDCGQWISASILPITAAPSEYEPSYQSPGTYFYKRTFTLSDCPITLATIDLPFIAGDNEVVDISVNGNSITLPNNIYHTSGQSAGPQNITSFLTSGTNTVIVEVENWGLGGNPTPTALLLCGDIVIDQSCSNCLNIAPSELSCELIARSGYRLNWCSIPGAIGYEVDIIYNSPACCEGPGEMYGEVLETVRNDVDVYTSEGCFSWRVRSICDSGPGPWSQPVCNCGSGKYDNDPGGEDQSRPELSIYPNPATNSFRLNGITGDAKIIISDLGGQVVEKTIVRSESSIDVSHLSTGIYLIEAVDQSGNQLKTKLFVTSDE